MDLNLLSTFVAVAEASSFSRAAERLRIPKSTVSRSIAALESELGVGLVHRTTRRVSLSTAGAALYEKVAPALQQLQRSVGELPEAEEQPSGELRITASNDFGVTILSGLVTRFCARYPSVTVDVRLTNREVDLVAEGFDVALRISSTERLRDSALSARKVRTLEGQLFASPEYLARRGTPRTPEELDGHDWVVMRVRPKLRLSTRGAEATVSPKGRVHADDMFFIREAVASGAGIGELPTFLAEADVVSGRLVRVLPRWNMRSGSLWLVTPHAPHVPKKVQAFRAFVMEALGGAT